MRLSALEKYLHNYKPGANSLMAIGIKLICRILVYLQNIKSFVNYKDYRNDVKLKLLNPLKLHQVSNFTKLDRYPKIFAECQNYFKDKKNLKILSYGCSTGEEVITLRQYFPEAFIVGAEINRQALDKCLILDVDDEIAFIYSDDEMIESLGPYDAIFCMAVFQRDIHRVNDKKITNINYLYPFSKFEKQICKLDLSLKKEGLLVIHHAMYSLEDTTVAARYNPLKIKDWVVRGPRFNRSGMLINNSFFENAIFIKGLE